jgi:hypothetical protein
MLITRHLVAKLVGNCNAELMRSRYSDVWATFPMSFHPLQRKVILTAPREALHTTPSLILEAVFMLCTKEPSEKVRLASF